MKCRDCKKELGEKYVKYQVFVGHLTLEEGVCTECADVYNTYKHYNADLEFCDNCGNKTDKYTLREFKKKKDVLKVCRQCFDQLCGFDPK